MATSFINKQVIIELLVDSFKENTRITSLFRVADRGNLRAFFEYCYHYTKELGHIYYTKEGNTVIFYLQNSKTKRVFTLSIWLIFLVIFFFKWRNIYSTQRLQKQVKRIRENEAMRSNHADFIYVWFLGGKSGSASLRGLINSKRKLVQESKKRQLAVYMETTVERLVPIYKKAGFRVYHLEAKGSHKIWFLKMDNHG